MENSKEQLENALRMNVQDPEDLAHPSIQAPFLLLFEGAIRASGLPRNNMSRLDFNDARMILKCIINRVWDFYRARLQKQMDVEIPIHIKNGI